MGRGGVRRGRCGRLDVQGGSARRGRGMERGNVARSGGKIWDERNSKGAAE